MMGTRRGIYWEMRGMLEDVVHSDETRTLFRRCSGGEIEVAVDPTPQVQRLAKALDGISNADAGTLPRPSAHITAP